MYIDNKFVEKYDHLVDDLLRKAKIPKGETYDALKGEVWIRVMNADNYDKSKGKVSTWLWYLGRSVIGNELKKMKRSQDALDHVDTDLSGAANVIGAEDAGTARDELGRMFKASKVSKRDESIFRDIHLNQLSYKEAEIKYSIGTEAVKKVMYRVMQAMRHVVAEA